MRLLTHNLLACPKCNSFPFQIEAKEVVPTDCEYDPEFVRRMLARIAYEDLVAAVASIKPRCPAMAHVNLPATLEQVNVASDMDPTMLSVYAALTGFAVKNGALRCPQCTTQFLITDFIPNMMVE
jgi:multifunctional methyltransferase subunit TRM112